MKLHTHVLAGALMLGSACISQAATAVFQDVDGASGFTFGGVAVTDATFKDSYVETGSGTNYINANYGGDQSMNLRKTAGGTVDSGLLAVTSLFTSLPAVNGSGGTLVINSATLSLASSGDYTGGYDLTVSRVTTNWLNTTTVDPQLYVSGVQHDGTTRTLSSSNTQVVSGGTTWAGGGFGSSNFTSTNATNVTYSAGPAYGTYQGINVTGIVQDMYAAGANYGFALTTTSPNLFKLRSSDDTLLTGTHETFRPALTIDYTYSPTPEPASLGALALGGIVLLRRRRSI